MSNETKEINGHHVTDIEKNIIDGIKVEKKLNYDANSIDIGVWGVSVVLGGALYGWNAALVTGFGMYSLAQGFVLTFTFLCVGLKSL